MVSVGRILLLSASAKHELKSPCSNISTVHSRRSCQPALRFTWSRRTRDFPYLFSATAIILASAIRRVAIWAQQQRDMKMLFPVSNMKCNLNQRIHAAHFARTEIGLGVETKTITPGAYRFVLVYQLTPLPFLLGSVRS